MTGFPVAVCRYGVVGLGATDGRTVRLYLNRRSAVAEIPPLVTFSLIDPKRRHLESDLDTGAYVGGGPISGVDGRRNLFRMALV